MELNHGLHELKVNISNNTIVINGKKYDWYGKLENEFSYSYSLQSEVNYKRYETKLQGHLVKINKKSVIIKDNEGREVKKDMKHFVVNNLYPELYYRIEHKETGIGPFQSKEVMSPKIKSLVEKRVQELKESYNYEDYPTPNTDKYISQTWYNLTTEFRKKYTKFACSYKRGIEDWFGFDLVNELLNNNFIIKEYQKGRDFSDIVHGENQVLLIMNQDL